ncbi:DUF2142 domain-containing protein [Nocardia arthritidis]|uniref:DUF2142 domain-containing protein n=1 Tax=Nocardia arthritidis TaxID=228602 RepID=A0A6G9Y4K3_9NOCA|nr:DUF2142 domain-containing protein [Nocardia arthritidis]QIS08132.1 DUF2142 domain-containing protein [Nocardia arthritidis]
MTTSAERAAALAETNGATTEESPAAAKIAAPSRYSRFIRRLFARFGAATIAFAVIATVFGTLFTYQTPAFWGHDEITQFGRAYQVAHGGFLPQRISDDRGVAYGGEVPRSIDALMGYAFEDYNRKIGEPDPMVSDPAAYGRLGSAPISSDTKTVWFTNTAAYSPVPYVPAAVGIRFAELIGLHTGGMVLLTRLAGLLAYLIVVGFGLWALRAHRVQWLAFTVAVLPIAIFQAGTVTADTMTNALAIMFSALLVKALFLGHRLRPVETAALLAATVLLPVSKPTYVLMAMLVVVAPADRLGLRGWLRWLPWVFAGIGAVAFAVWMKIAAPTGEGMGLMRPQAQWHSVKPGEQLHGILTDPGHFLSVFGDSVWLRDQRWFTQFFGELGFAYVDVPALSIVTCLLAFGIAIGTADRMNRDTATFRKTLIVALVVAASVAMIYVTLYMSFTPVDYYIIDGVQGRYFVPLAVLAFAALLRWMPLRLTGSAGRVPTTGAAWTVVIATVVALTAAVLKYTTVVWG